jgi:dienelactone hydrolase
MMHGCAGLFTATNAISARFRTWAAMLRAEGYALLLVDSFNPRGLRQQCTLPNRPVSATADRPGDARGALAFLQQDSRVAAERIALAGWSHGGGSTLATVVRRYSATAPLPEGPAGAPWFRARAV